MSVIKHQCIASKLSDIESFGADPRRVATAGHDVDGAEPIDFGKKYGDQNTAFKARFDSLDSKFNGKSLDDYVNGKSFCCSDKSLDEIEKNNTQTAENAKLEDNLYFYHPDHLGSTSMVTNYDGEVTQNVAYIPYGEVFVEERNGSWATPFLFNAKELDEETGLYYYGARYLNPVDCRWLSPDPMQGKYPGMTPYNYCAGNPVKLVDPDGRKLRYTKDATESFKNNFKSASLYLKSHNAGSILGDLDKIENTVIYIKEVNNRSSYYSPKKKTIFWNPNQGLETTEGKLLSPSTVLVHEADHALDDVMNSKQHEINRNTSDEDYDNVEERRVITGSETETAIKLGEIEKGELSRENHLGYNTQTSGPTSNEPINVNIPLLEEIVITPEKSSE